MLILLFLILSFICLLFLVFQKKKNESYKLMEDLEKLFQNEMNEETREKITKIRNKIARGGMKYGPGSDYDKFKQRRARGQIRDTGDDK